MVTLSPVTPVTHARDVYIQITCHQVSLLVKSGQIADFWRWSGRPEFASLLRPSCAWRRDRPMSGRRSRSKGVRTERSIVALLRASGIAAERVPLSGAAGGRFAGDIVWAVLDRDLCVEVKCRGQDYRKLYSRLEKRDLLVVKADRQEPAIAGGRTY